MCIWSLNIHRFDQQPQISEPSETQAGVQKPHLVCEPTLLSQFSQHLPLILPLLFFYLSSGVPLLSSNNLPKEYWKVLIYKKCPSH